MSKPTIIIISAVPWDGTTARPQHMAKGLAKRGWNVLFVDGPVTWLAPLRNRQMISHLVPKQPVREVPLPEGYGTLRVLSPIACLPFGNRYRFLNRINQRLLALQIGTAMPGPYVLLPMLPASVDLVAHLHPVAVLYDCVDFHAEFHGTLDPSVMEEMETDLVHVSRTVFATADALAERMSHHHADVRLVANAAEIQHFLQTPTASVHPKLHDIPTPRIGLVGGIGWWVDQEFIKYIAQALPQVHIVMVGPVETNVDSLRALPNVHFLGLQPYAELPQFLRGFEVTLVSFVQSELSKSVNPIKVYEYIAAGKEVIATPMHELKKLDSLIWITPTYDDAVAVVKRVLAGETRTDPETRTAFISSHSWDARVGEVDAAIQQAMPRSTPGKGTP
jgi:glycosyltransferase involved in cell wall biosynthesis